MRRAAKDLGANKKAVRKDGLLKCVGLLASLFLCSEQLRPIVLVVWIVRVAVDRGLLNFLLERRIGPLIRRFELIEPQFRTHISLEEFIEVTTQDCVGPRIL